MGRILLNNSFLITIGLILFFLIGNLLLTFYFLSKSDKLAKISILTREREDVFPEDNVLGKYFVRDFHRYNCKSSTRYGSSYKDPMYRIDGIH
jgi:hypothetical protein